MKKRGFLIIFAILLLLALYSVKAADCGEDITIEVEPSSPTCDNLNRITLIDTSYDCNNPPPPFRKCFDGYEEATISLPNGLDTTDPLNQEIKHDRNSVSWDVNCSAPDIYTVDITLAEGSKDPCTETIILDLGEGGGPDISVSIPTIPDMIIDDSQDVTITISNDGDKDAENVFVELSADNVDLDPASFTIEKIEAGSFETKTITITAVAIGISKLKVEIDEYGVSEESNVFEIKEEENTAPIIKDLPTISFYEGGSFSFDLDGYVYDDKTPQESIIWTYSGNVKVYVEIASNHVVTFTAEAGWTGTETITFTATDTGLLFSSKSTTVTVIKLECEANADCDDGNECTIDECVGNICQNTKVADGVACTDGVCCNGFCTEIECNSDEDCEENEECIDAGTCGAMCVGEECEIACYVDEECDDENENTEDICINPAECSAYCENRAPEGFLTIISPEEKAYDSSSVLLKYETDARECVFQLNQGSEISINKKELMIEAVRGRNVLKLTCGGISKEVTFEVNIPQETFTEDMKAPEEPLIVEEEDIEDIFEDLFPDELEDKLEKQKQTERALIITRSIDVGKNKTTIKLTLIPRAELIGVDVILSIPECAAENIEEILRLRSDYTKIEKLDYGNLIMWNFNSLKDKQEFYLEFNKQLSKECRDKIILVSVATFIGKTLLPGKGALFFSIIFFLITISALIVMDHVEDERETMRKALLRDWQLEHINKEVENSHELRGIVKSIEHEMRYQTAGAIQQRLESYPAASLTLRDKIPYLIRLADIETKIKSKFFTQEAVFVTIFLLTWILFSFADFMELLPSSLGYYKKILSFVMFVYLFYKINLARLMLGLRSGVERGTHMLVKLSKRMTSHVGLINFMILLGYVMLSMKTLTGYLFSSIEEETTLAFYKPLVGITHSFFSYIEGLNYAIGIFLLVFVAIYLTIQYNVRENSLVHTLAHKIANFFRNPNLTRIVDEKNESVRYLFIRFLIILFVLLAFYVIGFNLIIEWVAVNLDSPIIVATVIVYLIGIPRFFRTFMHPGQLIRKIGELGEDFSKKFVRMFPKEGTITLAIIGILFFHPLTKVASLIVPYLNNWHDLKYYMQPITNKITLFFLSTGQSVIGYVQSTNLDKTLVTILNVIFMLFILIVPFFILYKLIQRRKERLIHPLFQSSAIALFFASLISFILMRSFALSPIINKAVIGVNIVTQDILTHNLFGVSALTTVIIAFIVFVLVLVFSFNENIKFKAQSVLEFICLIGFGFYMFFFTTSAMSSYVFLIRSFNIFPIVSLSYSFSQFFFATSFTMLLIVTAIMYIIGSLAAFRIFLPEIWKDFRK